MFLLKRKSFTPRFASKRKLLKQSEKFEAKRSEKIEVKFYSEQAKHM
jgi:hypothetical protein